MTNLQDKARAYILESISPDIMGIIELFDYGVSEHQAREIYDLVLKAKVEVSWDDEYLNHPPLD